MTPRWQALLEHAAPWVAYLNRPTYFDRPYHGAVSGKLVVTDAVVAFRYASDDSFDEFDEWESVSDRLDIFPDGFEWKSWIDYNLLKSNFFGLASKHFNGADAKWTRHGVCLLQELMLRDMKVLLNCYANDFFPEIWRSILDVYLHDGFPCGWNGRYPQGELVVFSNDQTHGDSNRLEKHG